MERETKERNNDSETNGKETERQSDGKREQEIL
jgi:hypothetical protein